MFTDLLLIQFIAASLVVLLIPGPGVLYVVARSISQGYRAGLASVLGLSLGALVHVAAATAGLSAILLSSSTAFNVVKIVGATYLIYLGLSILLSKGVVLKTREVNKQSTLRIVTDGIVISVFNPKIALFFMAYLPQFVAHSGEDVSVQIMYLGIIYICLSIVTDGGYALSAGFIRDRLTGSFMRSPLPRCISGCMYLLLGLNAALTGRRSP